MIVYRFDRKTLTALGGLGAMRGLPVKEWGRLGQGAESHWEPLSWRIPDERIQGLGWTPMSKEDVQRLLIGRRLEA